MYSLAGEGVVAIPPGKRVSGNTCAIRCLFIFCLFVCLFIYLFVCFSFYFTSFVLFVVHWSKGKTLLLCWSITKMFTWYAEWLRVCPSPFIWTLQCVGVGEVKPVLAWKCCCRVVRETPINSFRHIHVAVGNIGQGTTFLNR